ncbi:Rossmann-fold NAD(P)-binding domain-containing protein [Parachitinimonas caeni]|uniref:Saccharopine dehydrogenase NADP binding domain-containing protein n=1 Tax=Parachitinimonas caeni TaxID=3031301 RepID=A0ABT7DRL8_9NEIS|nr:hypothetical protein [Parachitinimonas caeni]MDK2122718.1 hypothetical protein [Parachitinimonas caeni]
MPAKKSSRFRIAIIGLGDLGQRLALKLADHPAVGELLLLGRQTEAGSALARLVNACGDCRARFMALDALNEDAVASMLAAERPDLLVQCASLISPWLLFERHDPLAKTLLQAGFALQLPAQLAVVHRVMRACRAADFRGPVVNCSFPDATHPVLACAGLAPTVGVGNAGMILGLVRATLRDHGITWPLRLLAHHAHVGAVATANVARLAAEIPPPRLFAGDNELPPEWAFAGPALPQTRELNSLTAAHASQVIGALLPDSATLRTAVPGPLGLPGGWPVIMGNGAITLDLPSQVSQAEALAYHQSAAVADGIARIDADGTVHLTTHLQQTVAAIAPELAEPLSLDQAFPRFLLLQDLLRRPV